MARVAVALGPNQAFDLFENRLQDVSKVPPDWCPVCAFGLLHLLQDGTPTLHALQRERHSLWDLCMRHIVAESPPDEDEARAELQRNIDDCPSPRGYHFTMLSAWEKDYITDPLTLHRVLICLCLGRCLYGVDSPSNQIESRVLSRARDPHKRFGSSDGLWPAHPGQLFPHGPATTVIALCVACATWGDDAPWYILNAVLRLVRPRVIDLFTNIFIAPKLGMVSLAVIFHGTPYIRWDSGNPIHDDAPWIRSGDGLRVVASFLRTLWEGPYARPDDMYRFLSYHMPEFREAYSVAADRYTQTGLSEWRAVMIALHPAAPHVQESRQRVPDAQVVLHIEANPRGYSVLAVVWFAWRALHADKHCSAPSCGRTVLDEDGDRPPLPTCAKCRVARYCSTGCQRTDWRGGARIAHKRLCPILAALKNIADSVASQDEYANVLRTSGILDSELAVVGRWAASQSQHYMDIIRTEIAFPNPFIAASSEARSA